MRVRSQNGWPAFHTAEDGRFVRFTAGGRGFWAANADVAVVLGEYARRFDAEVEPIIVAGETYDDWSFADRLIRGSSAAVSNHGSATAIDLNATRHPLGVKGTFTAAELAEMRAIKNSITDDQGQPVLRLGIDYTGRVDAMHVEINASPARVKQAANKIRAQQEQEDDVSFQDKHKLTAADVAAYGSRTLKVGQEKSYDELVRFSPADARIRREMTAGFAALNSTIGALVNAIKGGSTLTAAQITQAAEAGARAALAELGQALDDDPAT